ncbi:MAG: peptidoglycan DD-metalloendopeptidase family protein [Candidatus Yonathbacteria bacterium]|nr:peptidoglycan DD-metalloendopeptidase family protein [Candidatus Yonathbacteria bacterium]
MRQFLYQCGIAVILGSAALTANSAIHAQTIDDLKGKISAKTEEIQRLEQSIKQHQNDIANLGTQKKTLKNSIAELDILRKKLDTDLRITQTKVDTADLKIRRLTSEISYKENEIVSRDAALKEVVRIIYERDAYSLPEVALSNDSFSGFWNDLEATQQFSDNVETNVAALKILKAELEVKHVAQQTEKGKLLELKSELGDRKKITEENKKEKSQLLTQTNSQESKFKKILSSEITLKEAFEQELRDYESTLKFILDPASIPSRGTKVFSAPLDNVFITQHFGKSSAVSASGQRLYASGTHNGTDFRAVVGTSVKAMRGGIVVGTGNTDLTCPGASFGKWVLIDHQNGLASISAHLSLIKVSKGDTVTNGQHIGYSGNTGYSTGPHLHISVYASKAVRIETHPSKSCSGRTYTMPIAAINAYLDPEDYL